jgi:hypothetical protein
MHSVPLVQNNRHRESGDAANALDIPRAIQQSRLSTDPVEVHHRLLQRQDPSYYR